MTCILGIETSCDETSAAVLRPDTPDPLASLVILSQDVHRIFGGVVPELASREHLKTISAVVDRAVADAGISNDAVTGIAVTAGPGLVGALLVGVMYGKTMAYALDIPVLGVNHLEGHLFAPTLEFPDLTPPFVSLLVSGGHTMLLDVRDWGDYRLLGQTLDDAAGEAFDKVAKLLGLGYPGGPIIEQIAAEGDPHRFRFPRPMLRDLKRPGPNQFAFSFSGLKTSVMRTIRNSPGLDADRADLASGFQEAAIETLVEKTACAAEVLGYSQVTIGGGVACNQALAQRMRRRLSGLATVTVASPKLNTDNAAMIAAAGAWRFARGEHSGWDLEPSDRLPMSGLHPSPGHENQ